MQRDLKIQNQVNNWTIIDGPILQEGSDHWLLKCNICGRETLFDQGYINRSCFSKQCRSCSQKERRKETGKYKLGDKINNLTIIGPPTQYKFNTYYKVQCDCGHIYHTGHSTFSRKDRLPYCTQCFNTYTKKPKRSTMYSEHISKSIFIRICRSAKLRGIKFDLLPNDLEEYILNQKFKCALSGIDINITKSFATKENRILNTASLDRIDSSKGYIKGNVQWVHKDINVMKLDLTQEQFINYCKLISNLHANQQPSQE